MSVSAAGILGLLHRHGLRVFRSSDVATLAGISGSSATQLLTRLAGTGSVSKMRRNLWVNRLAPDLNPFELVPYLRSPWPAYVSLYSALADHGLVSEIPQTVFCVTAANPVSITTPVGRFRFHHLPPRLIWGFESRTAGPARFPIADPEKAFLDQVYLALIPRSSIRLPVTRTPSWNLDRGRLRAYSRRFRFPPLTAWLRQNRLL